MLGLQRWPEAPIYISNSCRTYPYPQLPLSDQTDTCFRLVIFFWVLFFSFCRYPQRFISGNTFSVNYARSLMRSDPATAFQISTAVQISTRPFFSDFGFLIFSVPQQQRFISGNTCTSCTVNYARSLIREACAVRDANERWLPRPHRDWSLHNNFS